MPDPVLCPGRSKEIRFWSHGAQISKKISHNDKLLENGVTGCNDWGARWYKQDSHIQSQELVIYKDLKRISEEVIIRHIFYFLSISVCFRGF